LINEKKKMVGGYVRSRPDESSRGTGRASVVGDGISGDPLVAVVGVLRVVVADEGDTDSVNVGTLSVANETGTDTGTLLLLLLLLLLNHVEGESHAVNEDVLWLWWLLPLDATTSEDAEDATDKVPLPLLLLARLNVLPPTGTAVRCCGDDGSPNDVSVTRAAALIEETQDAKCNNAAGEPGSRRGLRWSTVSDVTQDHVVPDEQRRRRAAAAGQHQQQVRVIQARHTSSPCFFFLQCEEAVCGRDPRRGSCWPPVGMERRQRHRRQGRQQRRRRRRRPCGPDPV